MTTTKLHVEVIRRRESLENSKVLFENVMSELKNKVTLSLGERITNFSERIREHVEVMVVCDAEPLDEDDNPMRIIRGGEIFNVVDVLLSVHVYRLNDEGPQMETMEGEPGDNCGELVIGSTSTLPSVEFHGLWDLLVFDSEIKERLLNYGRAMLSYSCKNVDANIIASNRVILLHGPPGTGKTTLCKAIAQKLSIRLSSTFDHTIFLEINTHSLLSKYFSESGKLVTKMFRKITELVEDRSTLVCLLIDEVESLAHSRASASSGTEPSDSFRVVNSVLTQLDIIKTRPNVLVLSTSNIASAIDVAFVDRADIKQYIPYPSPFAIYTIHYSCLEELVRVGMVSGPLPLKLMDVDSFNNAHTTHCEIPNHPEQLLIRLSHASVGLSGRSLRKVPLLAHAFYLNPNLVATPSKFIRAMHRVVYSNKSDLDPSSAGEPVSLSHRVPNIPMPHHSNIDR